MADPDARYHAHIYFTAEQRPAAVALRERLRGRIGAGSEPRILFVGPVRDGPVGPHPVPQFETHFLARSRDAVIALIQPAGLTALVHPLTDNDLADHTSLAHWIGGPLTLDLTVLDPPGTNQGMPRFGRTDF